MPLDPASNSLTALMAGGGPGAGPGPSVAPSGDMPAGAGPGGAPGGGLPPELMKMALAARIAPQVMQQQGLDYLKKFNQQLMVLIRRAMERKGLPPKVVKDYADMLTKLASASSNIDKEQPQEAGPVESLLAQGMMSKPAMSSSVMQRLPVTR